ncbi:MAG: triose-phosphate isomerase [Deltaproteobacteria bacterium]|nr:triose-phosphate isomerase [Deltaproteobacteria bacterium]
MNRPPLVVANWKMNHTATDAAAFAERLVPELVPSARALSTGRLEVAIAPAFPALERLGRALAGSGVRLAAQNVHESTAGAFTGEVSAAMLEDLDCRFVLIGHSERRALFGDLDARIAAKLDRVLASRLSPILCIGETLAEREADQLEHVLDRQLEAPIALLRSRIEAGAESPRPAIAIAYEPVWAIGTGRVATSEIAQQAHVAIRRRLEAGLAPAAGQQIRILYGGSVKPDNARSLLALPDVDGALVGGASLDPLQFASIVSTCRETRLEPC